VTELVERVRRRLATDDPSESPDFDAILRAESGVIVDDSVFDTLRRDVTAQLTGAGPLEPLLALPGVTDVLVNAADAVWLDRGHGLERASVRFPDDAAVRRLGQRLAAAAGRRLDDASPFVDAVLPDGTRLHAVLAPLTPHTTLSLRMLARERYDLDGLVRRGAMSPAIGELLRALVRARLAILISGGTGSGKTTVLGALLGLVPSNERLVVIEDAAELVITHPHVVRLVTRAANVEGAGAVGLRELVRQSLRMRPDRLVVGEFRGAELVELLMALNTGHEGGCATLHANSASAVPSRLLALGALAGLPGPAVTSLAAGAIDAVVHLRRERDGSRVVDEVALLAREGEALTVHPVWDARLGTGPTAAGLGRLLRERDVPVPDVLR
jgi:pilus assembly protein CpaF